MILKGIEERRREVYRAEMAAQVYTMRPLATAHDAQAMIVDILKTRAWKKLSIVRRCKVAYVPQWDMESSCDWKDDNKIVGEMELTVGNLSEGTVSHELAHLAKGDNDNGHRFHFLRLQFAILDDNSMGAAETVLPHYAAELLSRNLITGREEWAKPYLKRWGEQMGRWASWLKPYLRD